MARKGENIYKRKDGRWEGRYIKSRSNSGKVYYGYIYGQKYSDVKERLRNCQTLPVVRKSSNTITASMDYSSLLTKWLNSKRIGIKESSYSRYSNLIQTHIIPELGALKVDELNETMIEDCLASLLTSGRTDGKGGLSSKTVCDILSIIKASIDYGNSQNLRISCSISKGIIHSSAPEVHVLSIDEQRRLTSFLMENIDPIKYGILLSLYTGIRLGEVCALKWKSINISDGILSVRETMQRIEDTSPEAAQKTKVIITEPKSKCSIRDIPLPIFLIELSKQIREAPDSFILSGDDERIVEPRALQYRYRRILMATNIAYTNYHVLRHTFATRCVEAGCEIKTLSEILGHSNVNITLNRYVHSSVELKRVNMERLSGYLFV